MAIKLLRLAAIILVTVSTTVTLIGCTSSFNAAGPPPPASAAASASGHNCMPNFTSGFDSRFAQVNGQTIHYWIGGTGPALVLLHGYPENGYTWHEVAPRLAATHTVIVPDLRGFGQSSRPETGYTTGELSEDVYQLITSLGYRQVDVAGHDWGGAVAYALAAAHRDSVRRMANLEAGAPPGFGQEAAQNQNPQLFWFVWLARAPAAESITAGREAEYLTPLYRDFSYNKIGISDSQLDGYLCSFRQPGAMHAGFMLYRDELRSADENKQFSRIPLTIPVLTVGGQYSLGDFSLTERQVALNVHGIIIPNAAHFLMSDNPQAVSSALADFFTP